MRRRILGSVFELGLSMSVLIHQCLQVPPGHDQPEGYCEDIPLPVAGGVAGQGSVQDPHRMDMANQGIVDYHPQPLGVSIFHLSLFILNDIRAIEPCIYIPGCRTRPRYPSTSAT